MAIKKSYLICLLLFLMAGTAARGAQSWRLVLPETVTVDGPRVCLADITTSPVPAAAGRVVVLGQGQPGTVVTLSRHVILRKLVEAGLAAGVIFKGATEVQVDFEGTEISSETLRKEIRKAVQPLVPSARSGAPDSWYELQIPDTALALTGRAAIRVLRTNPLVPGRNQLRVRAETASGHRDIPVTVVLHSFGEIPAARAAIRRGTPLQEEQFTWSWLDLAEVDGALVTDRGELAGVCAARTLTAGDRLRRNDLKSVPVIRAGDRVELRINRGGLMVAVNALARQEGCLGQTIPVRNELTGRLVNARILGSGIVEWR